MLWAAADVAAAQTWVASGARAAAAGVPKAEAGSVQLLEALGMCASAGGAATCSW
jgi:hypothetical protein